MKGLEHSHFFCWPVSY